MKDSYVEGLANHNGPESCGAAREGGVEALTGGRTGRVLSREIYALLRKQHRDPARSQTPCMYASTLYGNREIPRLSAAERAADRVGKPKGVRR
jgi:hypothetical protein